MKSICDRREFFRRYIIPGSFLGIAATLTRCDSSSRSSGSGAKEQAPEPCEDLSGVSENDRQIREKAAYVTVSPQHDKTCSNCHLYLPPSEGRACGGCMLFKGPVQPSGYCTYWVPSQAG
ncbi:MAG TPA: high-potential iron-sulfur protein [Cyclobacteriaceae bacterium]|nr:high-potential iron-sulfur protein [Cyclobacteriaceae bacterium]